MTYQNLGYTEVLAQYRIEQGLTSFEVGRVISEHKERYVVKTPENEFDAELIGNLRYTATSRHDFPAVGDWVAFSEYDEGKALIHAIYPRQTTLERQAVGTSGRIQIIATNIDYGLIVQAVDRDFNLNRLERYLTICNAASIQPLIVLSKIDLIEATELAAIKSQINQRVKEVSIVAVSNQTKGYASLEQVILKGKTYCLLGSSGVGKSTLLNHLSGTETMKTSAISTSVNKGRHTTSHRALIVLNKGGILIDNPGMREIGIADTASGLEITFDSILEYAEKCRFKDCTHRQEKGCAVLAAVESGEIEQAAYVNFRKMEKERQHFEADIQERRRKDKSLGKLYKKIIKEKRKHKF